MRCHHPGTAAPMVLETYEQVRPWAPMIKTAVENRIMPPGLVYRPDRGNPGLQEQPAALGSGDRDDRQLGGLGACRWATRPLLPQPVEWLPDHEYWQLEEDQGWGPPDLIITSPPFTVSCQ